jgi:hypothetical protein
MPNLASELQRRQGELVYQHILKYQSTPGIIFPTSLPTSTSTYTIIQAIASIKFLRGHKHIEGVRGLFI